jgi:holo-[acyl-carrier protein] synthase
MRVVGIGLDLVKIARLRAAVERWHERFLLRVFTEAERRYCFSRASPYASLAARFAVKEAVLKAIGTGWAQGVRWVEIEVLPDATGRPQASVNGRVRSLFRQAGVSGVHVTLSHDAEYAVGEAVLTADR